VKAQPPKPERRARKRLALPVHPELDAELKHGPHTAPTAVVAELHAPGSQIDIALAAYFIAEKRGFEPGRELDDWLAAEAEILRIERTSLQTRRRM
jgi:hypothetical protein